MSTIEDLNSLLAPLPGYGILSTAMKQGALDASKIPDGAGVWPGQPGYQVTYDIYWAALKLLGFLRAQPVVRQSSSEGTSVAVDAPDWSGVIAYYESMSHISGVVRQRGSVITAVPIPGGPHVVPVYMGDEVNDGSANVDTDAD